MSFRKPNNTLQKANPFLTQQIDKRNADYEFFGRTAVIKANECQRLTFLQDSEKSVPLGLTAEASGYFRFV